MSKITYIDNSAIGILVTCHGCERSASGQLRLAGVCDQVLSVLKMVSIDKVLALDPTVDAAVAAIGNA